MAEIYRRQSDVPIARMEQPRNFDTGDFERAVYIAAHRLVAARIWSYSKMHWELQKLGYDEVDERKIRYWTQRQPNLPELLISMGTAKPEDFPVWARPFLNTGDQTAPMAQERASESQSAGDLVAGLVEFAARVGLFLGGLKIAAELLGPRSASQPQAANVRERRIGRANR